VIVSHYVNPTKTQRKEQIIMNKQRLTDKQLKDRKIEKQKAFKRVVVKRVAKAIKAIELVANCSGPGYSYSEEQAQQVIAALAAALEKMTAIFKGKPDAPASFELKD